MKAQHLQPLVHPEFSRRGADVVAQRGSSSYLRNLRSAKIGLIIYSIVSITSIQIGSLLTSQRRYLSNMMEHAGYAMVKKGECESSMERFLGAAELPLCNDSKIKLREKREGDRRPMPTAASATLTEAQALKPAIDAESVFASTKPNSSTRQNVTEDHSMRACIFVRNDNHLLAEWIAYHYSVLPLRHLIVGCDENASDNPHDVLDRWKDTDLTFEVWYPQNYSQNLTYPDYNPLSRFRRRQPHFMSKCMQHFYNKGNRGWLALVDTDEYIKLNPLDDVLNKKIYNPVNNKPYKVSPTIVKESARYMAKNETVWDRVSMRKELRYRLGLEPSPEAASNSSDKIGNSFRVPTVLDVLEEYSLKHGTLPCHTMSRLRYGAVTDNATALSRQLCNPTLSSNVTALLNATNTLQRLSTIRFFYHAAPEHWKHNEWAKVLVDLRRIPLESLANVANPHQPLKECTGSFAHDLISFIQANHYLNDVNVFAGRKGDARQRKTADWEKMAYLRDGVRCDQMHGWLNHLVQEFGIDKVQDLLK